MLYIFIFVKGKTAKSTRTLLFTARSICTFLWKKYKQKKKQFFDWFQKGEKKNQKGSEDSIFTTKGVACEVWERSVRAESACLTFKTAWWIAEINIL